MAGEQALGEVYWYTSSKLQYVQSICRQIDNSTIDALISRKEYSFNY